MYIGIHVTQFLRVTSYLWYTVGCYIHVNLITIISPPLCSEWRGSWIWVWMVLTRKEHHYTLCLCVCDNDVDDRSQ